MNDMFLSFGKSPSCFIWRDVIATFSGHAEAKKRLIASEDETNE